MIELLVVVALIAIVSGIVTLSLRDPAESRLEQEAARLVALLESARAQARSSGIAASWQPVSDQPDHAGFRFVGTADDPPMPNQWLDPDTGAQVIGARAVILGPEPLIGEQRIVLRLGDRRLALATDGIGPFAVESIEAATP